MQIILDAARITEPASAHAYLKEMLRLPDYYGNNLDALYDCLTELPDTEILWEHIPQMDPYFQKVYRVFLAAEKENSQLHLLEWPG